VDFIFNPAAKLQYSQQTVLLLITAQWI